MDAVLMEIPDSQQTLVDFDAPDEAAGAIRLLLTGHARRSAMGEAARQTAERALAQDYAGTFRRMAHRLLAGEIAPG
jgi:hypothetical protein